MLGYEPQMVDLTKVRPKPLITKSRCPVFASDTGSRERDDTGSRVRLCVVVSTEVLEDETALPVLAALNNHPAFELLVISATQGREAIRESRFGSIQTLSHTEFSPSTLAKTTDICVFYGSSVSGERMAGFAMDLIKNAGVVVDCTDNGALAATGAPVVRGPATLQTIVPLLEGSVLPGRKAIGAGNASEKWVGDNSISKLLEVLGIVPEATVRTPDAKTPRTVIIPTNGVGLGHAQRSSLIAQEMGADHPVGFAAFPSCIPMLQAKGFDCAPLVQKSDFHSEPFANDLINYARLGKLMQRGDRLVFDGGYVFDSIYRTIVERELSAVWIRRGLWQAGQINHTPLERERVFDRVIVPAEAFDELNSAYTYGPDVHAVGPIVQQRDMTKKCRAGMRAKLETRFKRGFKKLVVTMLGGGVAADRSLQLQSLCAQFEARPDCLHLIVVWPNATISANLFGWKNSVVVRTQRALELSMAADLVISAVGYNSFHEILYHRIPAIFIPQMASYMDDQERRARAASDRGLAVTVLADELLVLEREVGAFLDGNKAGEIRQRMGDVSLPDPGNRAAARLIEGVGR
jgi:hypothetical protein